jgi:hypothetical protein
MLIGISGLFWLCSRSLAISIYRNHFNPGLILDPFDELGQQSLGEDVSLTSDLGPAEDEVIGIKVTAQVSDLVPDVALAYHSPSPNALGTSHGLRCAQNSLAHLTDLFRYGLGMIAACS